MHEEFQEICAAASIGQAAPEELARLHQHLPQCGRCRRIYSDFTNLAAQQYVDDLQRGDLTPEEEQQLANPDLLKRRFLERAKEKGILPLSPSRYPKRKHWLSNLADTWAGMSQSLRWKPAVASLCALIALVVAYRIRVHGVGARAEFRAASTVPAEQVFQRRTAVPSNVGGGPDSTATNLDLKTQVEHLQTELTRNEAQLRAVRDGLKAASDDKHTLIQERSRLETAIAKLQQRLADMEGLLQAANSEKNKLQEEATGLRNERATAQATYVEDQIRIRELREQLADKSAAVERDGQLLQRDRDIRDLMTARNLHIFDVFDTDAKGKTNPAFGRIFYTEGKSLIFYAYDLNEAKVQNANYHYRVWGSQDVQKDKTLSLGVFYSDDKSQRRWVFKCNDAKILNQIDSVFVTLEPPGATPSHPKGEKLLDAYIRGTANHP
jgi:hypothetical protein